MALPSILAGTPGASPTDFSQDYRIMQRFGARPEVYGAGGHDGIDFAPAKPGTKGVRVRAPHEGFLRQGWDPDGYGLYAMIVSDVYGPDKRRRVSILAHAEKFLKAHAEFVYAYDDVIVMGSTGFSTGIHTHWTYYVTDAMGRKLNLDNGHRGALDIAKDVVVDGGKRLSAFLPSKAAMKKYLAAEAHDDGACAMISPIASLEYLPLP